MDNKGWGLNTMLFMVCIILVALLLATFYAIRLNSYLGNENNESEETVKKIVDDSYYINKTNDITIAAQKYIKEYNIELTNEETKIYLSYLISYGYINNIYDKISNKPCSGYAKAYLNTDGIEIVKSYIKCDNYKTNGYGE